MKNIQVETKFFYQEGNETITFENYTCSVNVLRKNGKIPVNIDYRDRSIENQKFAIDEKAFMKIVKEYGSDLYARKFQLPDGKYALLKSASIHPIRQRISDLNFVCIKESDFKFPTRIILVKKELNRTKARFHVYNNTIPVMCNSSKILSKIEIDVSNVQVMDKITTDHLHNSEIPLPQGIPILTLV